MNYGLNLPYYNTTYIINCIQIEKINSFLEKLQKINVNGIWIIILQIKNDEQQIETFFRNAWSKSILNILVISNEMVYIYNPFIMTSNESRGKMYSFTINNSEEIYIIEKNRLENLHQYPLKVFLFSMDDAFTEKISYNVVYKSIDEEVTLILQHCMNFKINFVKNPDNYTIGKKLENGTFIGNFIDKTFHAIEFELFFQSFNYLGGLGMIENNELDIGSNLRVIQDVGTKNTIFLTTIKYMRMFYVMRSTEVEAKHLSIFLLNIFDFNGKIVFLGFLFIITILWYFFNNVNRIICKNFYKSDTHSIIEIILIIFKLNHIISCNNIKSRHGRIFLITLMFVSIIITSIYQGNILQQLKDIRRPNNIKTLERIADSDYRIVAITVFDIFETKKYGCKNANYILCRLIKKQIIDSDYLRVYMNEMNKSSDSNKTIILVRETFADQMVAKYFDPKTGMNLFHKIPESPIYYHVSSTVPKTSPFRRKFDELIMRMKQSGFIRYTNMIEQRKFEVEYIKRTLLGFGKEKDLIIIKTKHFEILFVFYLVMIVLTNIVFVCEVFVHALILKKKKKNRKTSRIFHRKPKRRVELSL